LGRSPITYGSPSAELQADQPTLLSHPPGIQESNAYKRLIDMHKEKQTLGLAWHQRMHTLDVLIELHKKTTHHDPVPNVVMCVLICLSHSSSMLAGSIFSTLVFHCIVNIPETKCLPCCRWNGMSVASCRVVLARVMTHAIENGDCLITDSSKCIMRFKPTWRTESVRSRSQCKSNYLQAQLGRRPTAT
jgi:hypothetical protein